MRRMLMISTLLFLASFVAGCGGGGGSSPVVADPPIVEKSGLCGQLTSNVAVRSVQVGIFQPGHAGDIGSGRPTYYWAVVADDLSFSANPPAGSYDIQITYTREVGNVFMTKYVYGVTYAPPVTDLGEIRL